VEAGTGFPCSLLSLDGREKCTIDLPRRGGIQDLEILGKVFEFAKTESLERILVIVEDQSVHSMHVKEPSYGRMIGYLEKSEDGYKVVERS